MIGNFWLSDQQFALIQPHLPYRAAGRRRADDRRIISGILHVLQSGCRWQDCPDVYGPHTTVYNRFNRWSQRGIWQYLFAALTSELAGTPDEISIDTTHVKAHRCAGGGKGGLLLRRLAAPKAAVTLIPTVIDQNPCAHLRMPRDMIFHGWSMRLFEAWQHSATMSS